MVKERENFSSRLGFILISVGCAIGLGNVWRFPYITGVYGGGLFVLIYIIFLLILGLPIMVMEFSVGRASKQSVATSFDVLEPKGSKWHIFKWFAMAGNYLLMMFYTTVSGWMLAYLFFMIRGDFVNITPEEVGEVFGSLISNPGANVFWMIIVSILGFGVCSLGLQNGVEKITKVMMSALFLIMIALVIRSVTLPNAGEGLKFYLLPNLKGLEENGIWSTIYAAMGQAFFTLSIGMGSMAIFGSYVSKERSLLGEGLNITILDTFVAVMAGLIIFPACFAFEVNPDSGPGLVFVTLPNIFNHMPMGRFWGIAFFVFMVFASLSTVIAVFENIVSFGIDLIGLSRKKAVLINFIAIVILSLPAALGFNMWSFITPFGEGSTILDLEDFIVSNNILPLGSLVYVLFCVTRYGWGWDNFIKEANTGVGLKFPQGLRFYLTFILPIIVLIIFVFGYIEKFA
ncbi:sodium-dependent transporter [Defluviitalea phaphyphila]|uniref:sodium-dependent transporter n=1 Tax=Defluviitalea phaphyphila TaxID=1473580 RepID=UPI0007305F43|nr:sodium-dependent transporter [Defluviitalea phaphyphila]